MPFHCFFLSWWHLWNFKALNVRNFVSIFCLYAWPVLILHNAYRGTWRLLPSLKKSLVTAHGLTTIISLSVVMQHRCLWITCRSEPQQHTDGTLKRCEWSIWIIWFLEFCGVYFWYIDSNVVSSSEVEEISNGKTKSTWALIWLSISSWMTLGNLLFFRVSFHIWKMWIVLSKSQNYYEC